MKLINPLVSVIIPGYKSDYIVQTIESVLAQSYSNYEIIVVDDGSPCRLDKILSNFVSEGRIIYCRQTNQKMAAAKNKGITLAKGHLLAFLDDDDLWNPQKLKKQVDKFYKPEIGMVYTFAEGFSGDKTIKIPNFNIARRGDILHDLFKEDFIPNSSVMISRQSFNACGYFNSSKDCYGVDDCELWTRIAGRFEVEVVPEVLTKIRIHGSRYSNARIAIATNDLKARSELIKKLKIPKRVAYIYFSRLYFDIAYNYRRTQKWKSFLYYAKSLYFRPSLKTFVAITKLIFSSLVPNNIP